MFPEIHFHLFDSEPFYKEHNDIPTVYIYNRYFTEYDEEEWTDMPEFNQPDNMSYRHVIVHFETPDDAKEFFSIISRSDTGKTKTIWFPEQETMDTESKRYE